MMPGHLFCAPGPTTRRALTGVPPSPLLLLSSTLLVPQLLVMASYSCVVLLLLILRLQALPPPLPPPPPFLSVVVVLILPPLLGTCGVLSGEEILSTRCKLGARDGGHTNCEDSREELLQTTEGLHTLVLLLLVLLLSLLLEPPRQPTTWLGCVRVRVGVMF